MYVESRQFSHPRVFNAPDEGVPRGIWYAMKSESFGKKTMAALQKLLGNGRVWHCWILYKLQEHQRHFYVSVLAAAAVRPKD